MTTAPKAIFLDIDGTLITDQSGPFPEDLEQIEEAHRRGHRVFLSTGRSLAHIPPELREAPWLDGIVAGAGAQVLLAGSTIYHNWIPPELLPGICSLYLENKKFCVFEGETGVFGINLPERFVLKSENIRIINSGDDFSVKYPGELISKLTLEGSISDQERCVLGTHFQLNTFPNYFEGIILGENKSKGMDKVLAVLGIPRSDSIAIGDSANDIDIIRAVGLGIAMGNACDELKALAGAITGNCGEGGVGAAIRRFVL
jgi:Cof subfamily protein (haloacid dehalogenase superfamily)